MIQHFFENEDKPVNFMCLPLKIKNKYNFAIQIALYCLISNTIRLDMVVACLVGVINSKIFREEYEDFLNDRKMSVWETNYLLAWIQTFECYVEVSSITDQLINGGNP